jgi:hypothetical protein
MAPMHVSKAKRAKSLELQEKRKHIHFRKVHSLNTDANHKIQSSIYTVGTKAQKKVNYVALAKHKTLNGWKPQSFMCLKIAQELNALRKRRLKRNESSDKTVLLVQV